MGVIGSSENQDECLEWQSSHGPPTVSLDVRDP
jgi:hypothetical protein